MAQIIKQGNLFGRIGAGIGKGLADQVPKEVERYRLSQGLKQFSEKSDNPLMKQYADLLSIPGITPQAVQTFGELAKNQNRANAYRNASGDYRKPDNQMGQKGNDLSSIQFANQENANMPSEQKNPAVQSTGNPQNISQDNPLNEQNLPRAPWTPEQRNEKIADYIDKGFLPDESKDLAANDEKRYLSEPEVFKERQSYIEDAKGKVRDTLKRYVETKLQKTGENVYKDVEGKMMINAERGMMQDLIRNPKSDIDKIANDWSDRLYETAVAKDKLRTLGKQTGIENFIKGDQKVKKLKEYQDIFKRSGNLEEFNNILRGNDFGLSPQAAASIAYPTNAKINSYISKFKSSSPLHYDQDKKDQRARKVAIEVGKDIGAEDSILAIAREFSQKDPFFDQQAFLDQISQDKDEISLNARQRLELAEGERDILPNWADLLYLPIFRRQ